MRHSFVLLAIIPVSVLAQFGPATPISTSAHYASQIVVADLNGDGSNDLLVSAFEGAQVSWYPGTGSGTFGDRVVIDATLIGADACAAADLDGDGDLDVLATSYYSDNVVWFRNDGAGNFGQLRLIGLVYEPYYVQATDMNADGLIDVIASVYGDDEVSIFWNQGNGQFGTEDVITGSAFDVRMTATGDLDSDGDIDLLSADQSGLAKYANNGDGTFGAREILNSNMYFKVHTADIDDDGDLDVLAGSFGDDRIEWFQNDGSGALTVQPLIGVTPSYMSNIYPCDLDGDGDLDVLAACWSNFSWYANNGSGVFGPAQVIEFSSDRPFAIVAGDMDTDGDQDVLVSTIYTDELNLYANNGNGQFGSAYLVAGIGATNPVQSFMADINGDGMRDVVVVSSGDNKVSWFAKAADGTTGPRQVVTTVTGMRSAHAADADGDGDTDLFSIYSSGLGLSLNNGTGTFGPRQTLGNMSALHDIASGDIDGDGDVDLLYGMVDVNGLKIALNNGNGTFVIPAVDNPTASQRFGSMLVDVDADGDLDMVHGDPSEDRYEWYANDGTGGFGPVQTIGTVTASTINAILWKDLNGDGLKDLVAATDDDARIVWFPNLGSGSFGPEQSGITLNGARGVDVADMDGDGDLDIAATSFSGGGVYYALNNGSGVFGTPVLITGASNGPIHLIADDMDGDGDPDLIVTANLGDQVDWYENYFGSAYRLEGTLYHDLNADGAYDANEPGAVWYTVQSTPFTSTPLTGPDGGFEFLVDPGSYSITALTGNPLWQISSVPSTYEVDLTATDPVATGLDLGITAVVDTSVINPSFTSAAGVCSEPVNQWISYANRGTRIEHGRVELDLDPLLTFNSATPAPDLVVGSHLEWNFEDLTYEEVRAITLNVTRPSANFIGDTLNALLSVLRMDAMDNVTDTFTNAWSEVILCSYDPNDKLVTPRGEGNTGIVDIGTPYLDYTIRFQNTGAAPAQDIILRDHLDPSIDPNRMEVLGYSHQPTRIVIEVGQELVVHFDGINLPDSSADLVASQGFITFRTPLRAGLPDGTCVENQALIFFDLNEPVITNTVVNTLVDCSLFTAEVSYLGEGQLTASAGTSYQWYLNGVAIPGATEDNYDATTTGQYAVVTTSNYICVAESDPVFVSINGIEEQGTNALRITPNPARDQAVLQSEDVLHPNSWIELLDPQGRVVTSMRGTGSHTMVLDVSKLSTGLYVLRFIDADGVSKAQRLVVE
ncbi:MAG: T9SS type A sorting domain-containing protein [Flavobacteriales bacterium]|nr:T9SS type A sorting domain-containing protein [Flavobacteriales bacterium]